MPSVATFSTPRRVAKVLTPKARSPSTSARSFVTAMATANVVTNAVMNACWLVVCLGRCFKAVLE